MKKRNYLPDMELGSACPLRSKDSECHEEDQSCAAYSYMRVRADFTEVYLEAADVRVQENKDEKKPTLR